MGCESVFPSSQIHVQQKALSSSLISVMKHKYIHMFTKDHSKQKRTLPSRVLSVQAVHPMIGTKRRVFDSTQEDKDTFPVSPQALES